MRIDEIEGLERLATKDDLRVLTAELKAAMSELKTDIIKWTVGIQLTFATLILGIVYTMLSHWKP